MSQAVVERWFQAFNTSGGPSEDDIRQLVTPDVRFVERPNLVNPTGSERDLAGMLAGISVGRKLLSAQEYRIGGYLEANTVVVARFEWTGTLAIDAGAWLAGTTLHAWCTAHYRIRDGRICHIEQYDCYEQPAAPD